MCRLAISICLFLPFLITHGQELKVVSQSDSAIKLRFSAGNLAVSELHSECASLTLDGAVNINKAKIPNLPQYVYPLSLATGEWIVAVEPVSVDTIQLSKPIVPGTGWYNVGAEPIMGAPYYGNDPFPKDVCSLSEGYSYHTVRGQNLKIVPFQYYPQTGKLLFFKEIVVSITTEDSEPRQYIPTKYEGMLSSYFVNSIGYANVMVRSDAFLRPKMLIVSPFRFLSAIQSFVEWKTQRGITVYTELLAGTESASDVKEIVTHYYAKYQIDYVLIIGDAGDVAPEYYLGHSDVAYGFVSGGDAYPELAVGRISASDSAGIVNQLNRIVAYEQNTRGGTPPAVSLIGSEEGPGDNGEFDYEHLRLIGQKMGDFGFGTLDELYDGAQGNFDADGNPTAEMLAQSINSGKDLAFYMGHGTVYSLQTSGVTVSDTTLLNNADRWPFLMIGGCQVGNFSGTTCFAEAFMQAKQTGFCGILASSIDQPWAPPMYAQDVFVDELLGNPNKALGALLLSAFVGMNAVYEDDGIRTSSTWNLFGDPTIYIHTRLATTIDLTLVDTVPAGTAQTSFICSVDSAYYSICNKSERIADGLTVSGENVAFHNPLLPGEYTVTVFEPNSVTSQKQLVVAPSDVPIAVVADATIVSSATNAIICGEPSVLQFAVANVSVLPITVTQVDLPKSSANVVFIPEAIDPFLLGEGETKLFESAGTFVCKDARADGMVDYAISLHWNGGQAEFSESAELIVPHYELQSVSFGRTVGSNDNGIVEPGEILQASIVLANTSESHSRPDSLAVFASGAIQSQLQAWHLSGDTLVADVLVIVSDSAVAGQQYGLDLVVGNDLFSNTVTISGDLMHVAEDWDAPSPDVLVWNMGGADGWASDSANPYSGNVALKSGAIGNDQQSVLQVEYTSAREDTLSFFAKVSCEAPGIFGDYIDYYDNLQFWIDDSLCQQWAGIKDWHKNSYVVSAGTHLFSWKYVKDYDLAEGDDAAWIDHMIFPEPATVNVEKISVADTVLSMYQFDEVAVQIPDYGQSAVSIHGAPDYILLAETNGTYTLEGVVPDTGSVSFFVSYAMGQAFVHNQYTFAVQERLPAKLSAHAYLGTETVVAGDTAWLYLSVSNIGMQSSDSVVVKLSVPEVLFIQASELKFAPVAEGGSVDTMLFCIPKKCLVADSLAVVAVDFYADTLVASIEDTLSVEGFGFAPEVQFVPEKVNNNDGIVQEYEQFVLLLSACQNEGKDLPSDTVLFSVFGRTTSNLVHWDSLCSSAELATIEIPSLVADSMLVYHYELRRANGCSLHYIDTVESFAFPYNVALPKADTVWTGIPFAYTLPANVDSVFLISSPSWLNVGTSGGVLELVGTAGIVNDTVAVMAMYGNNEILIDTLPLFVREPRPADVDISLQLFDGEGWPVDTILQRADYRLAISVSNTGQLPSVQTSVFCTTELNLQGSDSVIIPSIEPHATLLLDSAFRITTPYCIYNNAMVEIALAGKFGQNQWALDTVAYLVRSQGLSMDSLAFSPGMVHLADSVLQVGEMQQVSLFAMQEYASGFDSISASFAGMQWALADTLSTLFMQDSVRLYRLPEFQFFDYNINPEHFQVVAYADGCEYRLDSAFPVEMTDTLAIADTVLSNGAYRYCFADADAVLPISFDNWLAVQGECVSGIVPETSREGKGLYLLQKGDSIFYVSLQVVVEDIAIQANLPMHSAYDVWVGDMYIEVDVFSAVSNLMVIDVLGRIVFYADRADPQRIGMFVSSGVYTVTASTGDMLLSKKVVVP